MFYIIDGYRNSLINNTWFWQNAKETLYFLIMTGTILAVGAITFKRLRPHFGDVL